MQPKTIIITLACLVVTLALDAASAAGLRAEWVILTSGEKFQTDRSWEEEGRRKFRLNGLLVSVPESDVARIVPAGSTAAEPQVGKPANPPAPASGKLAATAPSTVRPNRKERLKGALRLPPPKTAAAVTPPAEAPTDRRQRPPGPQPTAAAPEGRQPQPPAPARKSAVFREYAWGMRPSSMPGLLLSQTNPAYGGVDEFYFPDEHLELGAAPLSGIVYGFWQNRLYTITIWTDGRPSYEKLRQWVIDTYGPGHQRKQDVERRVWYGDGSDRLLEFDETLNTGIFWMRSHQLHTRIAQLHTQ